MKVKIIILSVITMFFVKTVSAGNPVTSSTMNDQNSVEVTVYNNNLGFVRDTRSITLPTGEGELYVKDIASQIIAETVTVASLNEPEKLSLLEQTYEYDLINSRKLLDKYVGKTIKLQIWNQYHDRKDIIDATLMSNTDGPIYKIGNEIYLEHPGIKILPELPDNLFTAPTLTWLYRNNTEKPHTMEITYLTNNINWNADYIMTINENETTAKLSGWATINNQSGVLYKNARLTLVAGEVHRVQDIQRKRVFARAEMQMAMAPQFEEEGFFEYHTYDLQRNTTLKNNQSMQMSLLAASNVTIQKEFLVHGDMYSYTRSFRDEKQKQDVNVYLIFRNTAECNLGMPIPGGTIRFLKQDKDNAVQFIGEDRINHTPVNEEIKANIGKAFDVAAERIQTDYKQITTKIHESEWEISIRNHKEEDIIVGIIEPLPGNWSIISNSHPYKKTDAFTIRFDVEVPKDKEVKVSYRIKVGL
ncbi:MAG: DUF4139 domain-containing protein [Candidatus Kuenenia sp.]|nr:DUF4139 domain-containing protein [Candidatus Kuenenia hertensis]